jgi:hypothetical protein
MSIYKKDIVKAIAAILLAAVLGVATYLLTPNVLPQVAYATGATIQDDVSVAKNFIEGTLEAGGGYANIMYSPIVHLTFENGSECLYVGSMNWSTVTWSTEATINAHGLQELRVDWVMGFGAHGFFSDAFETLVAGRNFSWYGIYKKGSQINTMVHVDSHGTDLGTRFENNVLLVLNLNSATMSSGYTRGIGITHGLEIIYWEEPAPSSSQNASWKSGSCWGIGGWTMQTAQIRQIVGQSESASITFEGSAWINGNYTVTENDVTRNGSTASTKNISFGRTDMAFQNGRIETLSFKFSRVDIILFAQPEE